MKSLTLARAHSVGSLLILLALLLGSLMLPPAAFADDYFVGCGPAPQRFAQFIAGIEAANTSSGPDRLTLAPNCLYHFLAPLDTANQSALPEIRDDLLIRGQGATLQRDPDADRTFRLITIGNGAEVAIEDLAIRHGSASAGGGIYTAGGTNLTLTGVILSDNRSSSGGGLYSEGEVSMIGSRFEHNIASSGGGLYSKGKVTLTDTEVISNLGRSLYLDHTDGSITRSRLAHNGDSNSAGGVYITGGTLALTETMIISNTDKGVEAKNADVMMSGGQVSDNQFDGLHIDGGNLGLSGTVIKNNGNGGIVTGNAVIGDSTIISNTGRGLRINGNVTVDYSRFISNTEAGLDVQGNMTVRNSQFIGNQENGVVAYEGGVIENSYFADNRSSPNTGCGGAVIYKRANVSGSTFVRNSNSLLGGGLCALSLEATSFVVNNLFIENDAPKGSAIYALVDPETFPPSTGAITIMHNTIFHTATGGSAISAGVGQSFIYNNIIVGHNLSIQGYGGSLVEADHNLFFRTNFTYFGPLTGGPNDRTADPQFVDTANEDFRLRPGSPAIDKGLDRDVTVDLDGSPRPQGFGFDIGAYEFGNLSPGPGGFSIFLPLVIK